MDFFPNSVSCGGVVLLVRVLTISRQNLLICRDSMGVTKISTLYLNVILVFVKDCSSFRFFAVEFLRSYGGYNIHTGTCTIIIAT